METMKFRNFHISLIEEILEIVILGNTEIQKLCYLYNKSLASTFIFGWIFTDHMDLFSFFCQFSKTSTFGIIR